MTEREEATCEAVSVKNRDIRTLADVPHIMREISAIEERRNWQKERMYNITQRITGMPGAKGANRGLDDALSRLSEIDAQYEKQCMEYVRALLEAQRVLDSIKSRGMRCFVRMRYMSGKKDTEIREAMGMTRRGFERARRSIEEAACMEDVEWPEKFIEKNEKMCCNDSDTVL